MSASDVQLKIKWAGNEFNKPRALSVPEIKQMVKDRKGAVQAPKQIIATEALPLTGLGKPDKKALRAQYWTGDRAVG